MFSLPGGTGINENSNAVKFLVYINLGYGTELNFCFPINKKSKVLFQLAFIFSD